MRSTLSILGIVALWVSACAFMQLEPVPGRTGQHPVFRNDGKFVHTAGQLHLQVSNYGVTGSPFYGVFSNVPGAEWPPGSGNDYLYAAGLWVGALDASGIPHVTTSIGRTIRDFEMSPTFLPRNPCVPLPLDKVADVRETYEGAPGGNRIISASLNPDDDGDGRIDEDFLNGDDEAGLFDSTVTYVGSTGDLVKRRIQMGYMWDNPDDPARSQDNKGGDAPGFIGCMFLNHTTDPTGATAPRRVGITSFKFFAGNASFPNGGDPTNDVQRYLLMSDPTLNPDLVGQITSSRPLDYRVTMATGPFRSILPDSSLTISVAFVMGLGRGPTPAGGALVDNAIRAQQVFDGLYTDLDGDALTGTCGKETCLLNDQVGGRGFVYQIPESSLCRLRFHTDVNTVPQFADVTPWDPNTPCELQQAGKYVCQDVLGGTIPDGAHCASEDTITTVILAPTCTYVDFDCDVATGQGGKEHLVNWVAAAPLPLPFYAGQHGRGEVPDFMSHYTTHNDSAGTSAWFFPGDRKVTLKWNNFAEHVRDVQHGNLKTFIG